MHDKQTFGWAIEHLHNGRRVQRAGWNGKGMFLWLVREWDFETDLPENDPLNGCEVLSFIAMKTADDKIVPWLASQTDMLAADWSVVD